MTQATSPYSLPEDDLDRGKALAWAMYDWANSAFATTVMAGFFPLFFKQYWSAEVAATTSSFWLGLANTLASLVIMLVSPLLGAMADRGRAKKRWLLGLSLLGILTTAALALVAQGQWPVALLLYGLGVIGFSGANALYDALLVVVAGERHLDIVSALGFALGYLGGGLLFAGNVLLTLYPQAFGLPHATAAVKLAFLSVAVWWAVFSLPLLLWVPEPPRPDRLHGRAVLRASVRQLRQTLADIRRWRMVGVFLFAYWLYIDGVDTIVRMAVDYGLALGFSTQDLLLALLLTQGIGFPAALAFGKLGAWLGARQGILLGIGGYGLITVWGACIRQPWELYALAAAIGLVQGGIQSLSRSCYARLIPPEHAGAFFGVYNMLGTCAAVLGPVLMGWVSLMTGSPRASILSLLVLFISGALLLIRVNEAEGRHLATTRDQGDRYHSTSGGSDTR
jgi:UMF1 family MFS transporter